MAAGSVPHVDNMTNHDEQALALHRRLRGKIGVAAKYEVRTAEDLALVYTPGVAAVSQAIHARPSLVREFTMKRNSVAIVSDGSAVLGLGNIGPEAALPVMEGKALLFKQLADIDGIPIVLRTQSAQEIIAAVTAMAPTFGGINLEDIASPVCFEVEDALQDLGIPVFHDDQHGTAIVLLAALMNAAKVVGKRLDQLTIVINGAGAAGIAITKLLRCVGNEPQRCLPVGEIFVCDSRGIIARTRSDLNHVKQQLLNCTNREDRQGSVRDALKGADVFIGVSKGNLLTAADIAVMNPHPIIFAMANPTPEIMPDVAQKAGAAVIGTGRSDFPNQVNNALAFPGIFRGALDAGATRITEPMKLKAAFALAACVPSPTPQHILPQPLDRTVVTAVAAAVRSVTTTQEAVV